MTMDDEAVFISRSTLQYGLLTIRRHRNSSLSETMKKLAPIFLTVAITSAVFIGCDFVDGNSTYVEPEAPSQVEAQFDGHFTTRVDTTGNEDPEDMPPTTIP